MASKTPACVTHLVLVSVCPRSHGVYWPCEHLQVWDQGFVLTQVLPEVMSSIHSPYKFSFSLWLYIFKDLYMFLRCCFLKWICYVHCSFCFRNRSEQRLKPPNIWSTCWEHSSSFQLLTSKASGKVTNIYNKMERTRMVAVPQLYVLSTEPSHLPVYFRSYFFRGKIQAPNKIQMVF